ncbi:hypothetical protein pipiens_015563 [Culex pipiens pipiens]|uniref:Uncharacterized protein n=1 Tax=Culex pipiens pipiens TaxID=38569 RepID=A0ABD1CPZ1_CULPP
MSTDADNSTILNSIESPETKLASYQTAIPLKQPPRSLPLLLEIISVLESTGLALPPEVIARACKMKSSNTSLTSSGRIKNNVSLHDPAPNVFNTLANLNHIAKANFKDFLPEWRALRTRDLKPPLPANSTDYLHGLDCIMSTWFFEESTFYLLSYGAHQDTVAFLVKHLQLLPAMNYFFLNISMPPQQQQVLLCNQQHLHGRGAPLHVMHLEQLQYGGVWPLNKMNGDGGQKMSCITLRKFWYRRRCY